MDRYAKAYKAAMESLERDSKKKYTKEESLQFLLKLVCSIKTVISLLLNKTWRSMLNTPTVNQNTLQDE